MLVVLYCFEIGYLVQHLATFILIRQLLRTKSGEGICLDTQLTYLIATMSRVVWISDTMLIDFWLTYVEIFVGLILSAIIIYLIYQLNSQEICLASSTEIPFYSKWIVLLVISLILSYFYFPGDEGQGLDVQMLVSLTIYVEAIGILPQIVLFFNTKDSSMFNRKYISLLAVSRALRLVFWIFMVREGNTFTCLIAADIISLLSFSTFVYSFLKNYNNMTLLSDFKDN